MARNDTVIGDGTMIDMTGVSTTNVIDGGEYRCTLTKMSVRDTNDKAKKKVLVEATINDDNYPDLAGRKVYTNHTLEANSLWALKTTLLAFGADPDQISGRFSLEEVSTPLYGESAIAVVELVPHYKNPGEYQNNVKFKPEDFS